MFVAELDNDRLQSLIRDYKLRKSVRSTRLKKKRQVVAKAGGTGWRRGIWCCSECGPHF